MNSSHVAAAGITSMLADVLIYLSHWPLQAMGADTATSVAGLIVACVGGIVKIYQHKFSGNGNGAVQPNPVT